MSRQVGCQVESTEDGKQLPVLDQRGCLTMEAMCFTDQLGLHHQAVVERHVQRCMVCAQQLSGLAAVANSVHRARPRLPIPPEIKLLSRQLALRSAAQTEPAARRADPPRRRRRSTARTRVIRIPWYRSRSFQMALAAGVATGLLTIIVALLLK